ncbi:FAD-dependent oxidoreductase [Erythrobacter sp. HA6-11]
MGQQRSAIIIGGGIIGATSAYVLARDGWQVTLVERHAAVGQGTSLGNGRQLSYSHTNALASPRLLTRIPSLLAGCDPAFRMSLRADRGFWDWTLRFLANCNASANRRNTLAALRLAHRSKQAMARLLSEHTISFDRKQAGKMVLLESDADVASARKSLEAKQADGLKQHLLSAEEAIRIEPALEPVRERLRGVLYAPDDETGDCAQFAQSILDVAAREYGAQVLTGRQVQAVSRQSSQTVVTLSDGEELVGDLAIIAAGPAVNSLLKPLGHGLPIEPMKGYSFTAPLGNAPPRVSVTDHKRRIVFTHLGDRMLVAGIAEMGRVDLHVDSERLQSMISTAHASLPEAAVYSDADEGWVGLRPMTPNSLPIIRMLEPGIAVNAGQGMLGWTLAMGSAEQLSEVVKEAA